MIDLVLKFISWVKNIVILIVSLPVKLRSLVNSFTGFLSFLPNGLGTIIVGLILVCITFVVIYAIVKLVTNLL